MCPSAQEFHQLIDEERWVHCTPDSQQEEWKNDCVDWATPCRWVESFALQVTVWVELQRQTQSSCELSKLNDHCFQCQLVLSLVCTLARIWSAKGRRQLVRQKFRRADNSVTSVSKYEPKGGLRLTQNSMSRGFVSRSFSNVFSPRSTR